MMVAQTGTSKTGNVYRYYACVKQKKHQCNKKMVPKEKLEDFVVHKTMDFLMQDEIIERLSELLFRLQHAESPLLPRLEEQLREKEKEMENIVNAVQKGYATDILLERLEKLKHEKDEISVSIAKERIKCPTFSQEHFKCALLKFRSLDITNQEAKRKIIDTFINAIYVYDDSFRIIYNGSGKEEAIGKDMLESSSSFSRGAPTKSLRQPPRAFLLARNTVWKPPLCFRFCLPTYESNDICEQILIYVLTVVGKCDIMYAKYIRKERAHHGKQQSCPFLVNFLLGMDRKPCDQSLLA